MEQRVIKAFQLLDLCILTNQYNIKQIRTLFDTKYLFEKK